MSKISEMDIKYISELCKELTKVERREIHFSITKSGTATFREFPYSNGCLAVDGTSLNPSTPEELAICIKAIKKYLGNIIRIGNTIVDKSGNTYLITQAEKASTINLINTTTGRIAHTIWVLNPYNIRAKVLIDKLGKFTFPEG